MFDILTRKPINGVEGYDMPKKYFDPKMYFKVEENDKKKS